MAMMAHAMKKASQQIPMISLGSMVTEADSITPIARAQSLEHSCPSIVEFGRQPVVAQRRELAQFARSLVSSDDKFFMLERSRASHGADNCCVLVSPAGDDSRALKLPD